MTKAETAKKLFLEGYNCAQCLTGAFCDEMKMIFSDAVKIAAPFGGGMGRMREVCGAVSGMFIVLGSVKGYSDPMARNEKTDLYATVQALAEKFRQKNGSIICRELLLMNGNQQIALDNCPVPSERTPEYYASRNCPDRVADAAEMLDEYLRYPNNG